ncbi:MAG: zf-HC2 domain-containing protein [Bulleidia sp.]
MHDISCEICRDLIPLVNDGVASRESEEAVRKHCEHCPECASFLNGEISDDTHVFEKKLNRSVNLYAAIVLLAVMMYGISLTGGNNMLMNAVIMPVCGILGFLVFGWKAVYKTPVIILIFTAVQILSETDNGGISEVVMMVILYSIFAVIGIVIAALLKYALHKEEHV